jgi:fatty acid desaturase
MDQRQNYHPYRTSLLTGEQLREFSTLRPHRVMRDTLLLWVQILATWAAVAMWPAWWTVLLAIPVIGTRFYALFIIGHDGLHRRLFPTAARNDLWNDALVLGPIGAITRLNRVNHMSHHATLALPHDPDRFKYVGANKPTPLAYLLALTGIPYVWRAGRNVFFGPERRAHDPAEAARGSYRIRDVFILIAWQVFLLIGLTWLIGWWAYFVLWLLPVYVFAIAADMVRVFAEHSMPTGDEAADETKRLISFTSNWLERQFFAPMGMNFHAVHHLWPGIPYYRLAEVDLLVRRSSAGSAGLVWRGSYLRYLFEYASVRWFQKPAFA